MTATTKTAATPKTLIIYKGTIDGFIEDAEDKIFLSTVTQGGGNLPMLREAFFLLSGYDDRGNPIMFKASFGTFMTQTSQQDEVMGRMANFEKGFKMKMENNGLEVSEGTFFAGSESVNGMLLQDEVNAVIDWYNLQNQK